MTTVPTTTVSVLRTLFGWLRPSRWAPDAAPQEALTSVTITAADLAAGYRRSANDCPLALACNRELGGTWLIQPPYAVHITDNYKKTTYRLSNAAIAWVEGWDGGNALMTLGPLVLDDPRKAPGRAHNITL
jgi:hypothetical protein